MILPAPIVAPFKDIISLPIPMKWVEVPTIPDIWVVLIPIVVSATNKGASPIWSRGFLINFSIGNKTIVQSPSNSYRVSWIWISSTDNPV